MIIQSYSPILNYPVHRIEFEEVGGWSKRYSVGSLLFSLDITQIHIPKHWKFFLLF